VTGSPCVDQAEIRRKARRIQSNKNTVPRLVYYRCMFVSPRKVETQEMCGVGEGMEKAGLLMRRGATARHQSGGAAPTTLGVSRKAHTLA
jgi:hypothetical protein